MAGSRFLLKMKFMTQGKIVGTSTRKQGGSDNSDGIECLGFNYEVLAPIDRDTGQLTGRRRHQPIMIKKEADSASPKLMHAMLIQDVFETATLSFARPSSDRRECPFCTITLTNGVIAAIRRGAPLRGLSFQPDWANSGQPTESVTFMYGEIAVDELRDAMIPYWLMG
jgi:type VI secretion system Hcp family effector